MTSSAIPLMRTSGADSSARATEKTTVESAMTLAAVLAMEFMRALPACAPPCIGSTRGAAAGSASREAGADPRKGEVGSPLQDWNSTHNNCSKPRIGASCSCSVLNQRFAAWSPLRSLGGDVTIPFGNIVEGMILTGHSHVKHEVTL